MRQVTCTVPDEQYAAFMKVIKSLPFNIKVKEVVPAQAKQPAIAKSTK